MSKPKRAPAITGDNPAIVSPKGQADRLYRAAAECVRQRQRYAKLVESGAQDDEQGGALRIACICDEVLAQSIASYEDVASGAAGHREEEWWHRANGLWHASREYARRHRDCDVSARKFTTRSPKELAELAVEFDLEASALLALRHAVVAYRKVVPEADVIENGNPARVA